MGAEPLSIRARFFRVHAFIGLLSFMALAISVEVTDYYHIRRMLIGGFQDTATIASSLYAQGVTGNAAATFRDYPGLELFCVYSADGAILDHWRDAKLAHGCPSILTEVGIEMQGFTLHLAQEVISAKGYAGMIYIEGVLPTLQDWLLDAVINLGIMLVVGIVACFCAAHFGARSIARSIDAVQRQVECLKRNDIMFYQLSPVNMTRETAELASAVVGLRAHFASRMVAKETLTHVRNWHWELFSALLGVMRQRLRADSPLLAHLGDYNLLMQTECGDALPPATLFNLPQLLDTSLAGARRFHAPSTHVNLTASLQAKSAVQWTGQPELLEALLRHLLLIGLKRTRNGFVSLRLEIIPAPTLLHTHNLRILYEDSGTPLQQLQIEHWLAAVPDDAAPMALGHEISGLLLGRLIARLGGRMTGAVGKPNGITLEGVIPLSAALGAELRAAAEMEHNVCSIAPPLVLVVENDAEHRTVIAELFRSMRCDVMMVESHAAALQLVSILPFSVILLNANLAHADEDITRRLRYWMEDGSMPTIPCWVMLDKLSSTEISYWQQRGVKDLLLRPLQPSIISALRERLSGADAMFYHQFDAKVRQDLPPDILAVMPMMNQMLAGQVALLVAAMEQYEKQAELPPHIEEAHAVKSAALTLGYFRLAALMDYIEHAKSNRLLTSYAPNWKVIMQLLRSISLG